MSQQFKMELPLADVDIADAYIAADGLGCNVYLGFCRDAGILNPFIPEDCHSCIWQKGCEAEMRDPDGPWEKVTYPEHFWWRLEHLTEEQKRQLMEPDSDTMIIAPDCLDKFYKEPEGNVYRCPRCLSTRLDFGDVWIICEHCGYNEPLIDFPENVGRRVYDR